MIRVRLPAHLQTLAHVSGEIELDSRGTGHPIRTARRARARYPALRGTIRDQTTQRRRRFVRFFGGEEDLSHEPPDALLPDAIAQGVDVFSIVGAMAGG